MDISSLTPEQLASTPLLPNPSGAPPNFVNPPTRSNDATIAMTVMMAVMYFVLFAKLITRWKVVRQFGVDDWIILTAGIFMTACYALTVRILYYGALGRHSWDVPLSKVVDPYFGTSLYALQIFGPLPAFFAKASLLWFLHRLFPRYAKRWTSTAIWFGQGLNILTIVVITLVYTILCAPGADGTISRTRCPSETQVNIAQVTAAMYVFLDLFMLAIAVTSLWSLQMSQKRKIGAVLVMSVGLAACVCSILTLYFRVANNPNGDSTWNQVPPVTVANFEGMVAIITACLPSLPALWVDMQTNFIPSLRRFLSTISFSSSIHDYNQATPSMELRDGSPASGERSLDGKPSIGYRVENIDIPQQARSDSQ